MLAVMLTFSLGPIRLTTAIENLYSLKGIKPVMVVMLTLPSTHLNGIPVAGMTSTSMAVMGVNPSVELVSQERDTSLSPMLVKIRLVTGSGEAVQYNEKLVDRDCIEIFFIRRKINVFETICSKLTAYDNNCTTFQLQWL